MHLHPCALPQSPQPLSVWDMYVKFLSSVHMTFDAHVSQHETASQIVPSQTSRANGPSAEPIPMQRALAVPEGVPQAPVTQPTQHPLLQRKFFNTPSRGPAASNGVHANTNQMNGTGAAGAPMNGAGHRGDGVQEPSNQRLAQENMELRKKLAELV